MRLAYVISCYKFADQVVRLVDALDTKDAFFLIHADRKSGASYLREIQSQLGRRPNVVYLKRHNCWWGDFGHVEATLKAINYLVENNVSYDYLSILTGQDYPIQSSAKIEARLSKKKHTFIEFFRMPNTSWAGGGMDRLKKIHVFLAGKHYILHPEISRLLHRYILRPPVLNGKELDFYGGSSYATILKKHVDYIFGFIKANPGYKRFFKYTFISDEMFFQTILANSKYKKDLDSNNLRYIDWSNAEELPKILRSEDYKKLRSSQALFARKFDTSIDTDILTRIDKELLR